MALPAQKAFSAREKLPVELLRMIMADMAETAGAGIQRGHGCLQYELDRSIFRTSKTMLEQCSEASRLVMITYKGDEYCRPSAFVPVAGVSARKISIAWYTAEYKPFVDYLDMVERQRGADAIPTEMMCVVTLDAACTWLAIISCKQLANRILPGDSSIYELHLSVKHDKTISDRNGGNLYEAISLMPQESLDLHLIMMDETDQKADEIRECIKTPRKNAAIHCSAIYKSWMSKSSQHEQILPGLRNSSAQLDYCTCVCKLLIGINRTEPERLSSNVKSLIARQAGAALLDWTCLFHCDAPDEGPLGELREFEESSCDITGCPCLLWTGMQLGSGPTTSYDDATKCGIDSLLWLEICRWDVWIHLRRGLSNKDGNALINARDQMLKINEEMRPADRSKCFMHDLESFNTAVAKDIGSLAEQNGIDMSDDTIESKIESARTWNGGQRNMIPCW
jgi:hypothetical protein